MASQFGELLTEAIYKIKSLTSKPVGIIEEELGNALGKDGRASIESWRRPNSRPPAKVEDVIKLAHIIAEHTDFDRQWLQRFLHHGRHPNPKEFCNALFGPLPSDDEATASTSQPTTSKELPTQLPDKAYGKLVGRDTLIEEILGVLQSESGKRIIAIDGMGGIGKTALARELVDLSLEKQSFELAIWVESPKEKFIDLSYSQKSSDLTFETVLDGIARHLGARDIFKLKGSEKEARIRVLLQMQSILLILDNLETAKESQNEIAQKLLPLLGNSKAIFTSRQRFVGEMYPIHLTGLDEAGSLTFIRQEASEKSIRRVQTAEIAELKQIAHDTGGSPLALKLVVGQLVYLNLDHILTLLRDVQIPNQDSGEDEYFKLYQNIFFSSWKVLSDNSQRLLISMSHFAPNVGGTIEALELTSEIDKSTLIRAIRQLWRLSFLEVGESPKLNKIRYYLHALTQHFVLADIVKII